MPRGSRVVAEGTVRSVLQRLGGLATLPRTGLLHTPSHGFGHHVTCPGGPSKVCMASAPWVGSPRGRPGAQVARAVSLAAPRASQRPADLFGSREKAPALRLGDWVEMSRPPSRLLKDRGWVRISPRAAAAEAAHLLRL